MMVVMLREILLTSAWLVSAICTVLYWMLVLRIVLAWFGVHPAVHDHELVRGLYQVTDVILDPFRRLPLHIGFIDFSPILAFFALVAAQRLLAGWLTDLAYHL